MRISAAGLTAERFRMDVISSNLSNANTTRQLDANGVVVQEAYRRRVVSMSTSAEGPEIIAVSQDRSPLREQFDPGNPNADRRTGKVTYSNVQPIEEMVNMISASRAYEANLQAFNSARGMMRSALRIGQ